jgi:SAM-dependent methyltransferase
MSRYVARRRARRAFGGDPRGYDTGRPPYPRAIYDLLQARCGLGPGCATFEVGPGTGIATRELLRRGANPLVAIEADPRMASYLLSRLGPERRRLHVVLSPFEAAMLPEGLFDLGVAATSFHWTGERRGIGKVARLLRPGGWWAMWWSRHGDVNRPSAFHRAIQPLYRTRASGRSEARARNRFHRARERRIEILRATGRFDRVEHRTIRVPLTLTTRQVVALWASFSDILTRPASERRRFLSELARIADEQFGGKVRFDNLVTIYLARRTPSVTVKTRGR